MEKDSLDHILDIIDSLFGKKAKQSKKKRKITRKRTSSVQVERHKGNPIISPNEDHHWESLAVFNPAAVLIDDRVHLLYRAMGHDGVSRIGYASSPDGVNFDERLTSPVFTTHNPHRQCLPGKIYRYDPIIYPSGGGWGGCEDPRMVIIDDCIYLTFNAFDGWNFIRVGVTSLNKNDFLAKRWMWSNPLLISPTGQVHKSWVLFPEKINNKFALLHNLHCDDINRVRIAYVDDLKELDSDIAHIESPDPHSMPPRQCAWHHKMRGVGPPPLKTDKGWLVFYHAHDKHEGSRYKLGVMLLSLEDPTKIIARSSSPILEPNMYYENEWKPGVIFVCGAVIKDNTLFLYYGGGDKYTCVAHAPLETFLRELVRGSRPKFSLKNLLFGKQSSI